MRSPHRDDHRDVADAEQAHPVGDGHGQHGVGDGHGRRHPCDLDVGSRVGRVLQLSDTASAVVITNCAHEEVDTADAWSTDGVQALLDRQLPLTDRRERNLARARYRNTRVLVQSGASVAHLSDRRASASPMPAVDDWLGHPGGRVVTSFRHPWKNALPLVHVRIEGPRPTTHILPAGATTVSGGFPFGFTPGGSSSGGSSSGGGPGMPFGSGAPFFAELERLLSWHDGPVNWELARQVAVRTLGDSDRAISDTEVEDVRQAVRLADVWLDPVTALPAGAIAAEGWTRGRWIEVTLPVWRTLCDPVATRVADAMRGGISSGLAQIGDSGSGLPPEIAAQIPPGIDLSQLVSAGGPIMGMVNQVGGMLFGAQVGQAIGLLASEVVSATEVGLPLGPARTAALVPANVEAFGSGLEIGSDEVRIYLALREAASQRLYGHVPWLRAHVLGAVEEYARGIAVDPGAVSRAMGMIDPTRIMNPESLQEVLGEDVFEEATTAEQAAALARLEMRLALVEGWVETVTDAAAGKNLPAASRLREMLRRRRAEGGPAEQTFATLVGLNLRPRRLREAAALWQAVGDARGVDGRDGLWAHPDLLPNADDLATPQRFAAGETTSTVGDPMAELERLRNTPAREEPPRPEPKDNTGSDDDPRGGD